MHFSSRDRRRPEEGSALGVHADDSGVHNHAQGASIIQVGFSERWLLILLILVAFASLIFSAWALRDASEALTVSRGENAALRESVRSDFDRLRDAHAAEVAALREDFRRNNGKIEVLQYDHNALKAQLVSKGIYQATEH